MTTQPGDLVLDPTCGSGTTAYVAGVGAAEGAAPSLGRFVASGFGFELQPMLLATRAIAPTPRNTRREDLSSLLFVFMTLCSFFSYSIFSMSPGFQLLLIAASVGP
jgi:hypothetical protein